MKTGLIIFAFIIITFFVLPKLLLASPATDISQNDFIKRQQSDNNFILLDVRSKEEFDRGHIKGAININYSEITNNLDKIPKNKDLIMYCRTGRRVGVAANLLAKQGYEKLFHIKGDMNAWMRNNNPLTVN